MVTDEEELPLQQIAVVVFAEVRAVDQLDAEHVVEDMIRQQLHPRQVHRKRDQTWEVRTHMVRGLGTAWNYLGLVATSRAFRDERGEQL